MKKFLALMIAVVMAFSMVAIPVSAADVNAEVEKVETTVEEAFTFADKLANAIHKLVGDILAVFDKECPFCDEIHVKAPAEDENGNENGSENEGENGNENGGENEGENGGENEGEDKPVIVYPQVPENFPAKAEIPEDAIRVETVEGIADAIANAEDGAFLVLADGVYDEITFTKGNITLAAENATVGFINLNSKSNITLNGIKFDAAGAKEAVRGDGNSTGYVANIVATLKGKSSSNGHDIVIKNCTFTGTPREGFDHAPIYVNDYKRSGAHAYNYTVDGCLFETSALYEIYLGYFVKGDIFIRNNFIGNEHTTCAGILWGSNNASNVTFENNTAFNWTGVGAVGGSRSSTSVPVEFQVRNNTFVQVPEGAKTDYVYLKNYKSIDTFDVVNSLNTFIGSISSENANVLYEALS